MAYNFNEKQPQRFTSRKGEIVAKLNHKLQRRTANLEVARQIKEAIMANNGKVYNARFDKVCEGIADQANKGRATGNGYITTRIQRKRNNGNGHYYIEVEIRNYESRFNHTDYESHYLNVEISDYTNGRIKAETLEDPNFNKTNTNDIQKAVTQFDTTAELYSKLCEVADQFNETPYLLRSFMESVYISGIPNR